MLDWTIVVTAFAKLSTVGHRHPTLAMTKFVHENWVRIVNLSRTNPATFIGKRQSGIRKASLDRAGIGAAGGAILGAVTPLGRSEARCSAASRAAQPAH